jgi:hypothetical protein
MAILQAEMEGLNTPPVLRCQDCRFSQRSTSFALLGLLECRCPNLPEWSDLAANDDWPVTEIARRFDCKGKWFEPRLPKLSLWRRVLCWLRSHR